MAEVLIIDDEQFIQKLLDEILKPEGHHCVAAASADQAREILKASDFDLLLCDIQMPGESGLDFARRFLAEHTDAAVIMVTGVEDPQVAKEILRLGAYGYIIKPLDPNRVRISVANALLRRRLEIENRNYRERLEAMVSERTRDLQKTIGRLEQAQEALKQSEAKYREFVQQSGSIMLKLDCEGRIVSFNEYARKFFGYSEAELLNQPIVGTIVPPRESSGRNLEEMINDIIRHPEKYATNENENMRRNGDRVWVSWTNRPLVDAAGQVTGILCIGQDITEHKQAEQALTESEEKFRAISACARDAIIMMDNDGRISYWNPVAEKIFGFSSSEAMGKDLHRLIAPQRFYKDFQSNFTGFQQTGSGEALGQSLSLTARRKDGTEFPIELSLSAFQLKGRWHAVGLIRDISERRVLESQLVQAQKLESIGQLAAGIAHEINTPIQYVGDNTRFLRDALGDLDPLLGKYQQLVEAVKAGPVPGELLEEIKALCEKMDLSYLREEIPVAIKQSLEGVERVAAIVRAMKEFSHPGTEEKTPVDINKAIESTITVACNEWKYVAEMQTDFDPGLPLVPCLPGDFNQVILNMIVNAAHAIGEVVGDGANGKGTITIATRNKGDRAEIRIQDTGAGIAPENRNRIFDPFFTTKEVGRGTGQGLAISHNVIVEKHGGTLSVESEVGKGTTFIISLPLADEGGAV